MVETRQQEPCDLGRMLLAERTRSPAAPGRLQLEASFLRINYETRSSRTGKRAYRQEREIITTDYTLCRCTAIPSRQQRLLGEQQLALGKDTVEKNLRMVRTFVKNSRRTASARLGRMVATLLRT